MSKFRSKSQRRSLKNYVKAIKSAKKNLSLAEDHIKRVVEYQQQRIKAQLATTFKFASLNMHTLK
jgi:hypothetical protein